MWRFKLDHLCAMKYFKGQIQSQGSVSPQRVTSTQLFSCLCWELGQALWRKKAASEISPWWCLGFYCPLVLGVFSAIREIQTQVMKRNPICRFCKKMNTVKANSFYLYFLDIDLPSPPCNFEIHNG